MTQMTPSEAFVETLVAQRRHRRVRHRRLGLHGRARPVPARRHPLHPGRARAGRGPHGRRLCAGQRAGTACASPRTAPASPTSSPPIAAAYWAHCAGRGRSRPRPASMTHGPRRLPGDRAAADLLEDHEVPGAREQPGAHGRAHRPLLRPRDARDAARPSSTSRATIFYGEIECEIPQPHRASSAAPAASRASTRRPSCWRRRKFPVILAGGGVVMADGVEAMRWRSPSCCGARSSTATCTTTRSPRATRCGAARSATRARRRR